MSEKPLNIKALQKSFWALSRVKQEAFLKQLYQLSSENKDLFQLFLGPDESVVVERLKVQIRKETVDRVPRFKKLRVSKINALLRLADKYPISVLQRIEIQKEAWMGVMLFVIKKPMSPARYEVAGAKYLENYLDRLRNDILERSESESRLAETRDFLGNFLDKYALLEIRAVYKQWF